MLWNPDETSFFFQTDSMVSSQKGKGNTSLIKTVQHKMLFFNSKKTLALCSPIFTVPTITWCPRRRRFHRCTVCLLRSTGPAESGHYCSNCGSRHSRDHVSEIVIRCQLVFTMGLCVVRYENRIDNGKLQYFIKMILLYTSGDFQFR